MTIKEIIPLTNVKITTEKPVAEKPSIEQRIKIESPGRPISADILEDEHSKKQKKSIRIKKSKTEPKIIKKEKDSILIITEKPQAAQKIAQALGSPKRYALDGAYYYELEYNNQKVFVASAVGHLFGLSYVKGQKGWPIFDLEWKPAYAEKKAEFTKKYFDLIKILSQRAHTFVIATDYDIEGEVIGWNVLRFICKENNAKRMKFSTLTTEELKKAFENTSNELNWGNAYAGEARHIIDWLYGINLSRALMSAIKTSGSFRIISIGRVQGPALKIIVDREKEISNFKPEPYWQAFAHTNNLILKHPEDIFDKKILDKFSSIKEGIAETSVSEQKTSPPAPFDLTTLQKEAYRHIKLSPSETLSIAQKLYLEGIISYPRTSSQKIPDAIEPKKILKKLSMHFPEVEFATRSKPIEGKKSDPAHPSIYPTGEFRELEGKEKHLYELIVKRFISAFSPDLITLNKKIVLAALDSNGKEIKYIQKSKLNKVREDEEETKPTEFKEEEKTIKFQATAQTIINKGWTAVYPLSIEESSLPDLNGKVKISKIEFQEKQTSPPNRFSPASLVAILEKKNLGTKATRSVIIDTLFERGYLDGKSIQATPLGIKLIETLQEHSSIIIDENLTRSLEDEMEKIQESKNKFEEKKNKVVEKAKSIILDISKEFKSKEIEIGKALASGLQELRKEQQEANTLIPCKICKKGNLRIMYNKASRRYFISCSAYPDCKQTYSLPPNALIKKSENKLCDCGFPKLLAIRKAKRPWEFCFNPECPAEKAKREKYESKEKRTVENLAPHNLSTHKLSP